ncbi:MAG TPA: hypothetical protein VJ969_05745 [Desulfopila sp.]|nr:hypothetical protein [Desulfopila sp.]
MQENEMFKQRLQADLALVEARLIRFKTRGMGFTAAAKNSHEEQAEQLQEKIDALNERLGELEKVDEHLLGDFKATNEKSLQELQVLFEKTTRSFTAEPGVADLHGNDDGSFPYGQGLSGRSTE